MLTPQWIAKTTHGKLVRKESSAIKGFSIDSRNIQPGQIFLALKGPNHNGHHYLDEVFAKGALGAVIDEGFYGKSTPHPNLIIVNNVQKALHDMAGAYRKLFQMPLVGITGSVGKTTTKDLAGQMLQTRLKTYYSPGNHNNEIGLPLSLVNMPLGTEVGVFELGTQHPGELKPIANLLGPSIGVITAIGDAHRGFFESEEALAQEKWSIIEALPLAGGIAILNADTPSLRAKSTTQRFRVEFGIKRTAATYRAVDIVDKGLEGLAFTLVHPNGSLPMTSPLLGRHNIYNILAAISISMEMRVDVHAIQEVVANFWASPHRLERKASRLGIILDDCYNASPSAVKAAVSTFSQIETQKNKVFVFGGMNELGAESLNYHQQVASWVKDAGIKQIFTIGDMAAETARTLQKKHGWTPNQIQIARSMDELEAHIKDSLKDEDNLILVKGSRAMALDQLVDHLE